MKNDPSKTAISLIQKIKQEIEESNISIHTMIEEVKMMQFTIKPIHGDISLLIKKDHAFIAALWKLGKMDHIISTEASQLNNKEKKIFFNYIEHQKLSATQRISSHHTADFEVEIVKNKTISHTMLN
ncbi:MAG TPA: hypothetical protein VJB63_03925 [Patescibacteria group bacterium]|nr:hypothetical protein [Patescibacteria group bacterium]